MWEKGVEANPITKPLTISNVGDLPTSITIKVSPPFSCFKEVLTLPPKQEETIDIDFNPSTK